MKNAEKKIEEIRKILCDPDLCAEAMVAEIGGIVGDIDTTSEEENARDTKVIISELVPTNGRKSFNKLAKLMLDPANGGHYLRSYDTTVAGYVGGKVRRYWDGKSNTTSAHIKAFFASCGVKMTTKEFYALPCEPAPTLCI